MNGFSKIRLHVPEEVGRLIEERKIDMGDIQNVIEHAENTGEKFVNSSTGRSLASLRPDRVTYWVEYSIIGEDCQIHSAYSHRMEMKRKGKP